MKTNETTGGQVAILDAHSTIVRVRDLADDEVLDARHPLVREHGARCVYLPMGGSVGDRVAVDDDGEGRVIS